MAGKMKITLDFELTGEVRIFWSNCKYLKISSNLGWATQ